jgi:hypothetical protein
MTLIKATNSLGWCVEMFTRTTGWKQASGVFDTIEEATAFYDTIMFKGGNYRVYQALAKNKKEQA